MFVEAYCKRKKLSALFRLIADNPTISKLWNCSNIFACVAALCYLYGWPDDLLLAVMFTPGIYE